MSGEGKVRVVIRSRRVPMGIVNRTVPIFTPTGVLVGSTPSQLLVYDTSVDEENQRAISEAQKLARKLGLGLEVFDQARAGLFTRLLLRLGRNGSTSAEVTVPAQPAPMTAASSPTFSRGC